MTYPTNTQIDAAIPTNGERPSRALTNQALKDIARTSESLTSKAILSYATLEEAETAAATLPDGQIVEVAEDGTKHGVAAIYRVASLGLEFLRIKSDRPKLSDYSSILGAINAAQESGQKVAVTDDALIRIPSDALTLQVALDNLYPATPSCKIILFIAPGHEISSGVRLIGGDYSNFEIRSDEEVLLDSSFSKSQPFIYGASNSALPVVGCLFNALGTASAGVFVESGATAHILPGCGVKNCWGTGLKSFGGGYVSAKETIWTGCAVNGTTDAGITAWGGIIDATGGDVSNSLYYGAQAAHGGTLVFEFGKADDCARYGVRATDAGIIDFSAGMASRCGNYGLYAFQGSSINAPESIVTHCGIANVCAANASSINAYDANVSNSLQDGIIAQTGSQVTAINANVSNSTRRGASASGAGSTIDITGGDAKNCGETGVYAFDGAEVSFSLGDASNCVQAGLRAMRGARISALQAKANECQNGAWAESGAQILAPQIQATDCASYGLICDGAEIHASNATVSRAGVNGIRSVNGGRVVATGASAQKGVSPDIGTSTADIACFSGSTIIANSATGGINREANSLSANGVIFQ